MAPPAREIMPPLDARERLTGHLSLSRPRRAFPGGQISRLEGLASVTAPGRRQFRHARHISPAVCRRYPRFITTGRDCGRWPRPGLSHLAPVARLREEADCVRGRYGRGARRDAAARCRLRARPWASCRTSRRDYRILDCRVLLRLPSRRRNTAFSEVYTSMNGAENLCRALGQVLIASPRSRREDYAAGRLADVDGYQHDFAITGRLPVYFISSRTISSLCVVAMISAKYVS